MPSIKEYTDKIASLRNTHKMTRTMKMVSASKLRKAQHAQREASRYAAALSDVISRLAASVDSSAHPLLTPREKPKRALLVVFSSDKGLCGSFNHGVVKAARAWMAERKDRYEEIHLAYAGRRAYMALGRRFPLRAHHEDVTARPSFEGAQAIVDDFTEGFLDGTYDEVHLLYNTFKSAISQKPIFLQALPIEPAEVIHEATKYEANYTFEPSTKELLAELLPKTVTFKIYFALLENAAGEHGARMSAMDSATSNAESMIDDYTLLRNRARQAAITTELTEIISGAEAL